MIVVSYTIRVRRPGEAILACPKCARDVVALLCVGRESACLACVVRQTIAATPTTKASA